MKRLIANNGSLVMFSFILYLISFLVGLIISFGFDLTNPPIFEISTSYRVSDPTAFLFIEHNGSIIVSMILGSLLFGVTTIVNLLLNGAAFGMVISDMLKNGTSVIEIFSITFPHALFELPATWIAGAAGFKIPYELTRHFLGKKEHILNKQEINDFLTLAVTALILIVIAAFVEANITMKIAEVI